MKTPHRTLQVYKSYNFIDKDPIIDELRNIVHGIRYSEIHEMSGVSTAALHQWFHGKTKRPQFATVNAVARALGYEMRIMPRNGQRAAQRRDKVLQLVAAE